MSLKKIYKKKPVTKKNNNNNMYTTLKKKYNKSELSINIVIVRIYISKISLKNKKKISKKSNEFNTR